MRVILDTNVLVSGIFFRGAPFEILKAWHNGQFKLLVSPEILEEYFRVGEVLSKQFPGVEIGPFLELIHSESRLIKAPPLLKAVCEDPDDDKFIACAIAAKSQIIVSGDKRLLKTSGYLGIKVLSPREFVDDYLYGSPT